MIIMYTIVLLLFLSLIPFHTSTDLFSYYYVKRDSTTRSKQIILNYDVKEIENIYAETASNDVVKNEICSLSKIKKIALCQRILQLLHYPIYLNKIAFSIASVSCLKKPVRFQTLTPFLNNNLLLRQWMYPCYGRHDPIRTSFIEDDYYAKFYISAGPYSNTVFVHVYENDDNGEEWYSIYSYFTNVIIYNLPDIFINLTSITEELSLNESITRTRDTHQIEYIYQQEEKFLPKIDTICELSKEKITTLYQLILNNYHYKTYLGITLNRAAFYTFSPKCEQNNLTLTTRNREYSQKMINCFGRNNITNYGNILNDKYMYYFYISSGTRRNSIFVYNTNVLEMNLKEINKIDSKFILFEMIENLSVYDIEPTFITIEQLEQESVTTKNCIFAFMKIVAQLTSLQEVIEQAKKKLKHCPLKYHQIIKEGIGELKKDLLKLEKEYHEYPMNNNTKNNLKQSFIDNNPDLLSQRHLSEQYPWLQDMKEIISIFVKDPKNSTKKLKTRKEDK